MECANCGTPIGKLETPFVWRDQVVCGPCRLKLEAGDRASAPVAGVAPPVPGPTKAPAYASAHSRPAYPPAPSRPETHPLGCFAAVICCASTAVAVGGIVYDHAWIAGVDIVSVLIGLLLYAVARSMSR